MKHLHHVFTRTNQRDNNEDACLSFTVDISNTEEREEVSILLLSDGMGGHEHGEVISRTAVTGMASKISEHLFDKFTIPKISPNELLSLGSIDFEKVLHDSIVQTNNSVLELIASNKWSQAGATIVAVVVYGDQYFYGYLGDSRLYHWKNDQQALLRVTNDHNVPGILVQEGVINEQVAKYHAQKNQLVYFIGIDKVPSLEKVSFLGQGKLAEGDLLFLCSDGVNGNVEDKIDEIFKAHWSSEASAFNPDSFIKHLVDSGAEKGEKDNQTAVLLQFMGTSPKTAPKNRDESYPAKDQLIKERQEGVDNVPPSSVKEEAEKTKEDLNDIKTKPDKTSDSEVEEKAQVGTKSPEGELEDRVDGQKKSKRNFFQWLFSLFVRKEKNKAYSSDQGSPNDHLKH